MKRFLLLAASNTFPLIGEGATLTGCLNDSAENRAEANGPWKKSGWDAGYDLREALDDADNVRARLDELIARMNEADGMAILRLANSSHGTHFKDWVTGANVSCTVCHNSTWDKPRSFMSKLDYKRAFDKLKPGKRVFATFDSCESGNIGESFKLMSDITKLNRWIEPPPDIHRALSEPVAVKFNPKQCWTLAGCEENGTCADVHDDHPHGLFNRTLNTTVDARPALKLSQLTAAVNAAMTGQKCVPNGPEWSFLQED